ncbi:uncharacterized protein [Venturia canescens]|uniref:uncharacterized protein n=1 Tax=Venturia canescens TaxID=32260 RepID=UPI001C9BE6B5|nr:uncharacterized protein LOC122410565 [Venturia canescens]
MLNQREDLPRPIMVEDESNHSSSLDANVNAEVTHFTGLEERREDASQTNNIEVNVEVRHFTGLEERRADASQANDIENLPMPNVNEDESDHSSSLDANVQLKGEVNQKTTVELAQLL